MTDREVLVLAVLIGMRALAPLLIFRWNFAGGLLAILADGSDAILQDALGAEPLRGWYHEFDKVFDTYYLAIEAIVAWRWPDPIARSLAVSLFALRAVGVIVFEFTEYRGTLLIFPNVFENFYIFVAGMRSADRSFRFPSYRVALLAVVLVGCRKLIQEYVMHFHEAQTWHFVKEHIFQWR
jgi:hypothetical protein